MKYDFDTVIPRKNTGSLKWDALERFFGDDDLLAMWVADMDFRAPPEVIDAVKQRAADGVYGYTICPPSYYEAVGEWMKQRHGWSIDQDWIVFSPGIVPALNMLVQCLTRPGDRVIVQQPVYYPFMRAVRNNGCNVLNNTLINDGGRYRMDFGDLEKKARDPLAKLMILCSPHNPVGRVWSRDELSRLGDICRENNVTVVSDEIHADLVFPGHAHVPFASISDEYAGTSVVCTSPSKTFNLAGLQVSNIIIRDPDIRAGFKKALEKNGIGLPGAFGVTACEAAYRHGMPWLDELMQYLRRNLDFLRDFVRTRMHGIEIIEPEATYLVWLDFRKLNLDSKALRHLMRSAGRLALDDGFIFGSPEGDGYQRINIACPRSILEEGLIRMERAVVAHSPGNAGD